MEPILVSIYRIRPTSDEIRRLHQQLPGACRAGLLVKWRYYDSSRNLPGRALKDCSPIPTAIAGALTLRRLARVYLRWPEKIEGRIESARQALNRY